MTTSIKELVVNAGYRPDSHKGKINDKIKNSLTLLSDNTIIDLDEEIMVLKVNQMFKLKFIDDAVFGSDRYFTKLTYDELDCIISSDIGLDKPLLLFAFLAIKQYISADPKATSARTLAYPSYPTIRRIIGVSSNDTVERLLHGLCDMGLLFMKNCGRYLLDGRYRNCPNCYALEEKNLKDAEMYMKADLGIDKFYPIKSANSEVLNTTDKTKYDGKKVQIDTAKEDQTDNDYEWIDDFSGEGADFFEKLMEG